MGRHKKVVAVCVHWWWIDGFNQGVCKRCGEKRDFAALLLKGRSYPPYANPRNTRQ
jgi:hypothetical protein